MARKYVVQGYPTVVIMNAQGVEYDRIPGFTPPADFEAQVEDYRAGRNTLTTLLEQEPGHLDDMAFLSRLADKLNGHGRGSEALARYHRIFDRDTSGSEYAQKAGFWIARVAARDGHDDQALVACERWLERYRETPNCKYVYALQAEIFERGGHPERAIEVYERFVKEFPEDPDVADARTKIEQMKKSAKQEAGGS